MNGIMDWIFWGTGATFWLFAAIVLLAVLSGRIKFGRMTLEELNDEAGRKE